MTRRRLPKVDEPGRYLFVARPRCPDCASPELRAYASRRSVDGTVSRHCACRRCGRRVIVVWE